MHSYVLLSCFHSSKDKFVDTRQLHSINGSMWRIFEAFSANLLFACHQWLGMSAPRNNTRSCLELTSCSYCSSFFFFFKLWVYVIHEKLLNLATPSFSSKNPTGPWFPWRSCQSEKLILPCLLRGRGRLRTRLARFLFGLTALLSNPVAQLRLGGEGERPPCSASSVNASGCV